jgi:hypothetical protein
MLKLRNGNVAFGAAVRRLWRGIGGLGQTIRTRGVCSSVIQPYEITPLGLQADNDAKLDAS